MTTVSTPLPPTARNAPQGIALAWQGWHVGVPADWSPIKIEGDFDRGFVAMADLDRERLGVRWQTARKNADPKKVVADAMRGEVGQLAFEESIESTSDAWPAARLYIEPDPPGRDVWIGYSAATKRVVQIVYQATARDRVLRDSIVPTIADGGEAGGAASEWSVFWLNVALPRPLKLLSQRLNVGDLSLSFATQQGDLVVRQVAAARVATSRRPMEKWLATVSEPKRYRPIGKSEPVTVAGMAGLRQRHVRRRRLWWLRWVAREYVAYCVHDVASDRLAILRAPDDHWAEETIAGLGRSGEDD
jgi:hypothetical protein